MNPSLAPLPVAKEGDMTGREKLLYGSALLAGLAVVFLTLTVLRSQYIIALDRVDADTGSSNGAGK